MNLTKGDAGNRSAAAPHSNNTDRQQHQQKLQHHRGEKNSSASLASLSAPSRRGAEMPSAATLASLASVGTSMSEPEINYLSNTPALMDVWASVASWFFRPEYSPLLGAPATLHPSAAANRPPPPPPHLILPNSMIPSAVAGGSGAEPAMAACRVSKSTATSLPGPDVIGATSTLLHPSPHAHTMTANKEGLPTGRSERTFQVPTICTAIRCTIASCNCDCFVPGKRHLRYCDTCKHGWVPHALDKLGTRHLFSNSAPEPVQPNAAFDIASLILYGCQALPIRLKILLDRLFSVLQQEQVLQVLHGFGWTPEDYARGYILQQEAHGCNNLDKWSICSPEEEPLVLQQFLRFGETRAITQQLLIAQQVLQQEPLPTLERLHERLAANSSSQQHHALGLPGLQQPHVRQQRAMSPSRRPASPITSTPLSAAVFHPSARVPPAIATVAPSMSPHQKHPIHFHKLSPPIGPPTVNTSPSQNVTSSPSVNTSPLNRLQNMQPFDFRKLGTSAGLASVFPSRMSPELSPGHHRRRTSDSCESTTVTTASSMGLNLSMSTCLPPPPPLPPLPISHSAAVMAAAVSANSLAAANLVASSFPSLVCTKMSTGSRSPSSAVDFPCANSTSDIAGSDYEDDILDENPHTVLNLSRDKEVRKSSASASHFSQASSTSRAQRGLPGRKSSATTPMKRHWGSPNLPLNLGTQFINPATGKKRVQCNVCLKTFCDKGALKIHFSAVHLREMHKCTVEGCNMMFSSRRSRNRHSANPNPKLHSPHLRRKISPHDGRSAQAHPILIPPASAMSLPAAAAAAAAALNPLNHFGPFPLLTQPPEMRHHPGSSLPIEFKHSLDLSMQRIDDKNSSSECSGMSLVTTNSSNHPDDEDDDDDDDDDDGIVVVGGDDDDEPERCDTTNGISDEPEDFSMPTKRAKVSSSDADEEIGSNVDSNEDSLSVVDTQSLKDESVIPTSKRKRKNQNPTRCAVAPVMINDVATDEESSNDVFTESIPVRPTEPSSNMRNSLSPVQEQVLEAASIISNCESPLNLEKVSPDVNANDTSQRTEIKTSLAPLFSLDKVKREKNVQDTEIVTEEEDIDMERPASSMESNKSDESFDCSNALRQLESLSHGHFGELISRGLTSNHGNQLIAQSPQFPPLGFMMGGSTARIVAPPSPSRSQTSSAGSSNDGADSGDENSQNQIYGHFDNGQFISTMDVPIDKDNPRKCTACGKVFQNHFGVKTHYQNVHLKLMHKCNVDGCNAAFPSKRSRDRHSANLNLHRKLLSTSSDKSPPAGLFMEKSPFASLANNTSLPNEFLARIYAEESFLLKSGHPLHFEQLMMNGDRIPAPPPPGLLLPPPLGGLPFPLNNLGYFSQINGPTMTSNSNRRHGERSSNSSSPLSASSPPPTTSPSVYSPPPTSKTAMSVSVPEKLVHCVEEDMPTRDRDGRLPCRLCRGYFADGGQLKQHCEERHIGEMHRCPVPSCAKVFLSRTKRNAHAANDAAHQQLLMASRLCSVPESQEPHVSVSS